MSAEVTVSEKYGPVLCLNPEDKHRFQFGIAKAVLIINNLDAIVAFVAQHGKGRPTTDVNPEDVV